MASRLRNPYFSLSGFVWKKVAWDLDIYSIMLLAVGLAMDAFSVAVVTGFSIDSVSISQASKISVNFGAFHMFMPILGWLAGSTVVWLIADYDHWVAFLLLVFVGGKMIYEAMVSKKRIEPSKVLNDINMLLFSVAVSIDAIAVGLSFYLESIPILLPTIIAGVVTFAFTFVGMTLGNRMGRFVGKGAQIFGGFVLIAIGIRIVFTHIR